MANYPEWLIRGVVGEEKVGSALGDVEITKQEASGEMRFTSCPQEGECLALENLKLSVCSCILFLFLFFPLEKGIRSPSVTNSSVLLT